MTMYHSVASIAHVILKRCVSSKHKTKLYDGEI